MPGIAAQNVTVEPLQPHVELMNPQTGDVWLCQAPIGYDEFKALKVSAPLVKSGCTSGSFDAAHFRRSPRAQADGDLETCVIDGRSFSRAACVVKFAGLGRGEAPTLVMVEKHHVMTFAKGRKIRLAEIPGHGWFVQQTESVPGKTFKTPAEWRVREVALAEDWTVFVAPPVSVWFFTSLASFQGPLAAESLPETVAKVDTV